MKNSTLTVILSLMIGLLSNNSSAQDNTGTEFYFTLFAETYIDHLPSLYVVGNYDATVTIDYFARDPALDQAGDPQCTKYTFNLVGGVPQMVSIPYDLQVLCYRYADNYDTPETVQKNGIRVTSTAPVAIYSQFLAQASSEMTPILPVTAMGNEYFVAAYREITSVDNDFNARVTVIAIEDNTNVNFTLPLNCWTSNNANGGIKRTPGSTWSVTLNKGETYTIISNDNGQALTATPAGSTVTIDNNQGLNGVRINSTKKVSVMGGADCTWAGNDEYPGCGACDLTCTHFRPTSKWKQNYVTTQTLIRPLQTSLAVGLTQPPVPNIQPYPANFNSMSVADYLLIMAKDNGTNITITGQQSYNKTLNVGEWFIYESPGISNPVTPPPLTNPGASHHRIVANKPIQVVQMMKGWQCDNINPADPTQMLVMEEELWKDNYIIANPSQYINNFFAFIVKEPNGNSDARNTLELVVAGVPIPIPAGASPTGDGLGGWQRIGTTPYYFQRLTVNSGAALKARSIPTTPGGPKYPFAFYASGSTNASSYGYMGGAVCNLEIFGGADPDTVCLGDVINLGLDSTKFGGTIAGLELFQYTWDILDATNSNISSTSGTSTSVDFAYTTTASGTMTAIIDLIDIAGCQARDTFTFFVNTPPVVNDIPDFSACNSVNLPSITGTNLTGNQAYYTATNGGGTKFLPGAQITTSGTYFIFDSSGENCSSEQSVIITINSSPIVESNTILSSCEATNTTYTVQFNITGGNGGPYTVTEINPGVGGSLTGNIYNSNAISSGTAFTYQVTDANACPAAVVTGSKNCLCTSDAGSMSSTKVEACTATAITVTPTSQPTLDGNDVINYILHDNPSAVIGNVLSTTSIPTVSFIPATMLYGTTYYVSRVVGNDQAGDVDLTDNCLAIAPGTPVVWYEPLALTISNTGDICKNTSGQLDFAITGAAPFNLVYSNGTTNKNLLNIGNTASDIVNPLSTKTYTIVSLVSTTTNCQLKFGAVSPSTTIQVMDAPQTANKTENCDSDNMTYRVSFDVSSGQGPFNTTVIAPAGINGVFSGTTWTSDPINSGDAYDFDLNDVNNCGIAKVSGLKTCECISNAGGMDMVAQSTCGVEELIASPNPSAPTVLDGNDVLSYILHDSPNVLGNVIQIKTTPNFTFDSGSMVYGSSYYISSAVGNNNGSGLVDLNDPCLDVSTGSPVKWNESPEITITQNGPVCEGENLQISANVQSSIPNAVYAWTGPNSFFSNDPSFEITNGLVNQSGDYVLTVTSGECLSSQTLSVSILPSAKADFDFELLSKPNENPIYQFNNQSTGANSYSWEFGDGQSSTESDPQHEFVEIDLVLYTQLIAYSSNGCNDSTIKSIDLRLIPENEEVLVFIPNSFSPDGNEHNQYFVPVFNESLDPTMVEFTVFNRWGEIVFKTSDIKIGWDGTYKQMLSENGMYTWKIKFRDRHTLERYDLDGHVNLMR